MTTTERNIITIILAALNGAAWALVAWLLFGWPPWAVHTVFVVTGLVCWVLVRVFQVVGEDA